MTTILRSFTLFALAAFILACSTTKKTTETATEAVSTATETMMDKPLKLIFSGLEDVEGKLAFVFMIKNESEKAASILSPRPVVEYGSFVPANVPPEFFKLTVLPTNALCEYAPMNSGTTNVKTFADFVTIEPGTAYTFSINPSHFYGEICDSSIPEAKVVLNYHFDERYLEKSFFEAQVKNKGRLSDTESDELFNLLKDTYRMDMQTDTISLEVEAFMR